MISPSGHDDLTTQYLHFSGALRYPDNPLTPYVGASLGITRLSVYDSVIKPSMSALGVQPKINDRMALMAELRGYGTAFSSDSEFICDPPLFVGRKSKANLPASYRQISDLRSIFKAAAESLAAEIPAECTSRSRDNAQGA